MPVPEISELKASTRRIVKKAKKEGTLSELTARIIRQKVEDEFSLDPGILDVKHYKNAVKDALKAAMEGDSSEEETEVIVKPVKKRKSDSKDNVKPMTKKPKTAVTSKSPKDEKALVPESSSKRKTSELKGKYKSSAMVPTSDLEEDVEMKPVSHTVVVSTSRLSSGTAKENKRADKTPIKKLSKKPDSSEGTSKAKVQKPAEQSESELSVLVDEPPKRKKKVKGNQSDKKPTAKPKKEKKPAVELSKDEETIKRLKGLVVACGTRKIWAKEFHGLDTQPQQIKRLKEMLAELGMTGRLSLEQAKTIKERRELAQELEDVRSFERSVVGGSNQDRSKAKSISGSDDEPGEHSEDEDIPSKRMNARKSIMAFLDDQSDDD